MDMDKIVKELTWEERATWGKCSICGAEHGEMCSPEYGIPLGRNINGEIPKEGVHLARLSKAPKKVELKPVNDG